MNRFIRRSSQGLVIVAVSLAIAACGAAPGVSPSTGPSSMPSVEPSPSVIASPIRSAEPSGNPPPGGVGAPLYAYARVVTNDLRIRSKPGVSDDSKQLEPLLQEGVLLAVLDGPVRASGFDWFQVVQTYAFEMEEQIAYPTGWVAGADKNGEPWLQPEAIDCPPFPKSLIDVGTVSETDQMHFEITCFGGEEITFHAQLGTPETWCGLEPPWSWDPSWFGTCMARPQFLVGEDDPNFWLYPAWDPDVDLSIAPVWDAPLGKWPMVEVTGMFDHPAAKTCTNRLVAEEADLPAPDPAETILGCRHQFVVTSMTEIEG